MSTTWRTRLLGGPRDLRSPKTYHAISLAAVLAWVGLGADPLSSSAYGPDEAFRALGEHAYLAVAVAFATTITVVTLSLAYSQIIQRFPFGGGGYTVATETLGPRWGVVSGAALLVDYVLTISVSLASAGDQVFSVLGPELEYLKLPLEFGAIALLVALNLRGVRESVTVLAPIFALFVVTHAILIFGGIGSHLAGIPAVVDEVRTGFGTGVTTLGIAGLFGLFLRSYTMGGGTYTGIEAVSNGIQIMREPKVDTARRTMLYIAGSLAVTASGLLVVYLLFDVSPEPGKTLNAVALERFAGSWQPGGLPLGHAFVIVALVSEAALLFVAAQAGFLDGPRVMANMARDNWLPHRFVQLSERLTVQDGVLIMGGAAALTLLYAKGSITTLVTMYAINIFVTFSISQLGMVRYWLRARTREAVASRNGLMINGIALLLCFSILLGTLYEKVDEGGWVTIIVTTSLVLLCFWIRRHYRAVEGALRSLEEAMPAVTGGLEAAPPVQLERSGITAIMMVGGYGGLGIHALLSVQRLFPGHFKNFVFASVGVIDAAVTKGIEEVDRVQANVEESLKQYTDLARRLGLAADYRLTIGTEAVESGEKLAAEIHEDFPRSVVFLGNLVFEKERWFGRILHNDTAFRLQRRLQFAGLDAMVLPVRVRQPLPVEERAHLPYASSDLRPA